MRIIFTTTALKDSEERLFSASKHRSKRIHKKLIKRFGGEFRKQPCMWKVGETIYAHPFYKTALEAHTARLETSSYPTSSIYQNSLYPW